MLNVPDSTSLADMTIPGTHVSAATETNTTGADNELAICQMWPIDQQLEAGIRYFDLRVYPRDLNGTKLLWMYHGEYELK